MHSPALDEQSLLLGGAAGHLTHHPAPPSLFMEHLHTQSSVLDSGEKDT